MTLIDAHGNVHQSSGTIGAGQFAGKSNTAPSGTLEPTDADVRRASATIERVARAVSRDYRFDEHTTQDIIQDSWLDLVNRNKPLGELIGEGNDSLLKLVTRTVATRHTVGVKHGLRHEDFQARRELQAEEAAFASTHDRDMNKREREEAAHRIRMSHPAGRRPKTDFYVLRGSLSIDAENQNGTDSDGTTIAGSLANPEPAPADEASHAAYALHEFENSDPATRESIRKDVWRLATESLGAPQPSPGVLKGNSKAPAFRRSMREADGGAAGVAQRWLNGESTEAEAQALFAPFQRQGMTARDEDGVAEALLRHPAYAPKLWEAAMSTATRSV